MPDSKLRVIRSLIQFILVATALSGMSACGGGGGGGGGSSTSGGAGTNSYALPSSVSTTGQ